MSQTNCSTAQTNCSKHATHRLAFTSSPFLPSFHVSPSIFSRLSLSLWIIITYHTGLIIASKRVSMKTLIAAFGSARSALIPSHAAWKETAEEKQESKPSSESVPHQIYAAFERDKHSTKNPDAKSCFWVFMIFVLQKHCASFSAVITVATTPRGQFYSNNKASLKAVSCADYVFFSWRGYRLKSD